MNESMNEEGNNEEEKERGDNKNEGTFASRQKVSLFGEV